MEKSKKAKEVKHFPARIEIETFNAVESAKKKTKKSINTLLNESLVLNPEINKHL